MAEFTDQEKELLDKLRKGFEHDAKTRSQLEPWQELLDRDTTINANRASAASKILEGFSGSWAAQYKFGVGSTVLPTGNLASEAVAGVDPQGPPVPIRAKTTKLGLRGPPEINFVPYNWRTNTFGNKGPSLVGHPIGFQVVGPTLKSPVMDWTWRVEEGAGPNGGDLLRMDVQADGTGNVMEPYAGGSLVFAYGPFAKSGWTIGDSAEPNGGLYVLITDDGLNPGSLPAGRVPMAALDRFVDTGRYELFRVASLPLVVPGTPYIIELHPDKRLSTYFDLPLASVDRSIKAITMVRPYVTRLQAVPQSGAAGGSSGETVSGREQTFVVVSPERAATSEHYPPFEGPVLGDGTWVQGGFTDSRAPGSTTPGDKDLYGGASRLPIPNPVQEVAAVVENTFVSPLLTGQWALEVADPLAYTTGLFSSWFPIVNISVTQRDDDLPTLQLGTIPSCLGWFDATALLAVPDRILLSRVPETDPQTGLTYWGPGPRVTTGGGTRNTRVFATLHEPIEALWFGEFNLDRVDSSRLTNLIDPQWVGRFEKQISDPLLVGGEAAPPPGASPGRPDRAIFDTRSEATGGPIPNAENPGNLMDLGFRMVLFPAKPDPNDPTQTIPNFDLPITGRELVIDGSIAEKQYVDIDYSSGVVRLSHPPPGSRVTVPNEPSDVIPDGISGTTGNNTRGEVVLFAACVPYSMEDSQLGAGVRLTASDDEGLRDFDSYSTEISAKIDIASTLFVASSPFIGVSGLTAAVEIVLDRIWEGPETGVITIQNGSDQGTPFGPWGYSTKRTVAGPGGGLVTALGGITAKLNSVNPDPSLFPGAQTRLVVLRREVAFRRESFSIPLTTNFAPSDTYYGSSTRADVLRFQKARLQPELDGSMTVRPLPEFGFQERITGRLSPSKMPYPIGNVNLAAPAGQYFGEDGILTGIDYQYNFLGTPSKGGIYRLGQGGPSLEFSTDANGPPNISYHGFITVPTPALDEGMFQMANNFRFVAKISMAVRLPGQSPKAFIGLVQDSVAPTLPPTVDFITQGPTGGAEPGLPPRYHVIGLQLNDLNPSRTWRFWTRGASGVENLVNTPAVSVPPADQIGSPLYFVIEVERYGPNYIGQSNIVKLGVFDANKNLLSSINVTHVDLLPDPVGGGFFVCGGIRRPPVNDPGPSYMNFYNVSVVLEKDLGTFDLPRLP